MLVNPNARSGGMERNSGRSFLQTQCDIPAGPDGGLAGMFS